MSGFSFVQSAHGGSSLNAPTLAYASNNTAGNLLILAARLSSTGQTLAITDSQSNTWTQAATQVQTTDGHTAYLWYAANCAGGANTVTITQSGSGTNSNNYVIAEYSGAAAASPLDKTASAQTNTTAVSTSGNTATTSGPSELMIGVATASGSNNGALTPITLGGIAGTQRDQALTLAGFKIALMDAVTTAAGAVGLSATWGTTTYNVTGIIATFQPAGTPLTGQVVTTGKGFPVASPAGIPTGQAITSGYGSFALSIGVLNTGQQIVSAQGAMFAGSLTGLRVTSGNPGVCIPGVAVSVPGLLIVSGVGVLGNQAAQRVSLPTAPPTTRSVNMQALCYEVAGPVPPYPIYQFSRGRVFIKRPYQNDAAGEVAGANSSGGGPGL
jgi:hypothetical protein